MQNKDNIWNDICEQNKEKLWMTKSELKKLKIEQNQILLLNEFLTKRTKKVGKVFVLTADYLLMKSNSKMEVTSVKESYKKAIKLSYTKCVWHKAANSEEFNQIQFLKNNSTFNLFTKDKELF